MTEKKRLAENVEMIFELFKGEEVTPGIPVKIERAIRDIGSTISYGDIEKAMNFFLENGYIYATVAVYHIVKGRELEIRLHFRERKPRAKKKK